MKPYVLEEIDEFGNAFGRVVWCETFDVPELHTRHGGVLDIVTGEMVLNVDDLGCNTAKEMEAAYSWLIGPARVQFSAQAEAATDLATIAAEIATAEAAEADRVAPDMAAAEEAEAERVTSEAAAAEFGEDTP